MTEENTSKLSYEYIAGFFDGEGYIAISKSSPGGHSRSPYYLVCSMANTHPTILSEIQKTMGGQVVYFGKRHPHFRLTFYTRQAYNFIRTLLPYLVIKRREAELAIEFIEYIMSTSYFFNHGRNKMTTEDMAARHTYYLKMKAMKGNRGANKIFNFERGYR